jgi:hypothetical protein
MDIDDVRVPGKLRVKDDALSTMRGHVVEASAKGKDQAGEYVIVVDPTDPRRRKLRFGPGALERAE